MPARPQPGKRDTQAALATAMKIDAIESEMSSEFVTLANTQPGNTGLRANTVPLTAPANQAPSHARPAPSAPSSARTAKPAAAEMGSTTEFLLEGQSTVYDMAVPASDAIAVIEEVAVMYANGQSVIAEQLLQTAIAEDSLGEYAVRAWWMLLDLYQILGKQQPFEALAVEYASRFECSPPAWHDYQRQEPRHAATAAGTTPTVPFSGKLDDNAGKTIERVRKLAESYRTLRLEFTRVTEVTQSGCGLLLESLKALQKSGHELVLIGAPDLADKIRSTVEVGRRDDSESAWLLLLEILRLLNREKDFEETSIDYCVTFEVSPPAFVAPQNKITTAAPDTLSREQSQEEEAFTMPARIEGRIDDLIVAIAAYSDHHNPAIVDCSQLVRIDFNAAGRLLTGLMPFCGSGRAIEFHHVNHLVAELFRMMGLHDIVRILPRKN